MSRRMSVLIAVLALAFAAFPAGAETADPCVDADSGDAAFEARQTYIHQAETKVGNLGAVGATGFPSWDDEAPTASVQGGAGGGYLTTPVDQVAPNNDEPTGLTVIGSFSGCLDTMLIELYAALPTNRTGTSGELNESAFNGRLKISVDGEEVLFPTLAEGKTIPNPGGDATYQIRYAITDINEAMLDLGLDPTADHEVRLNVTPQYVNTSNAIFFYDTTEVPSGILFNGTPDETYTAVSAF